LTLPLSVNIIPQDSDEKEKKMEKSMRREEKGRMEKRTGKWREWGGKGSESLEKKKWMRREKE
jgi:hypothetical protein